MNILAILAAALSNIVIGVIWYSPFLFGKSLSKNSEVDGKESTRHHYIASFTGAFGAAFGLEYFFYLMNITTIIAALSFAFAIWFGFIASATLFPVILGKKKISWYLVTNGFQILSLFSMAAILFLM